MATPPASSPAAGSPESAADGIPAFAAPTKQQPAESEPRCSLDLVPKRAGVVTSLITLLPPDEDQDPAFSRLLSDPETMKFLKFMMRPNGYSEEQAGWRRRARDEGQLRKELVNYTIAIPQTRIPRQLVQKIDQKEYLPPRRVPVDGGEVAMGERYLVVGCCGISELDLSNHCAKAGIIVDARLWRHRVSSAALYLTLKFGFETLNLHRIALETTKDNLGMRGWLENVAGVQVECVRKEVLYLDGAGYIDSWDYAIFDHQWYGYLEQRLRSRVGPEA
ncbi:hypothetical protein GQ54DRAFT_295865 [Martensiomyces pterosporus]|nr:hypothetical protein GQ54DRAFT_295865 [Martensiomyces pterosporus]